MLLLRANVFSLLSIFLFNSLSLDKKGTVEEKMYEKQVSEKRRIGAPCMFCAADRGTRDSV